MKKLPINKKIIADRINVIQQSLKRLKDLQSLTVGKFMLPDNFAIAEHYLRYALEATFDICSHILARIPGVEANEYKKIALEMGRQKIVPLDFAQKKLEKMAGYRNRLTHFYFEVSSKEMYGIIKNDLGDFEIFLKQIKKLIT